MKKITVALTLILMIALSACADKGAEEALVIQDEIPSSETTQSLKYTITFAMPDSAIQATAATPADKVWYEAADGSYCIITEITPQSDAASVIQDMTGFAPEELDIIRSQRLSMPEYRFRWVSEGEKGLEVCSGAVLEDTGYSYSIQFRAAEDCAKDCRDIRDDVLSSFSLFYDEGY